MEKKAFASGQGGRAVFTQAEGAQRNPFMLVQTSMLAAMIAEKCDLSELWPLLSFSEPRDKLLLSLCEGAITSVVGLGPQLT